MGRLSAYAKNRILKLRFKKNKRIIHIVDILKRDDNIKVSRQAVSTFLKKYLETNSIYDKPRTGRKRKLTQEEIQLIGQVTRLNRDITARAIKEYLNLNVSTYTILRATKLFEWNKINPNSNDSKKAAALERQQNSDVVKRRRSNSASSTGKKPKRKSNANDGNESASVVPHSDDNDLSAGGNPNESLVSLNDNLTENESDINEIERIQDKLLLNNNKEIKQSNEPSDEVTSPKPVVKPPRHTVNSIPELEKVDLSLIPHKELLILKNLSCSPMSFATKILFKIFKIEELHGHNVSGKTLNKNLKAKLPLDPVRIGYIKFLVEKYYDEKECKEMLSGAITHKQDLWKSCHTAINKSILISERKAASSVNGKASNTDLDNLTANGDITGEAMSGLDNSVNTSKVSNRKRYDTDETSSSDDDDDFESSKDFTPKRKIVNNKSNTTGCIKNSRAGKKRNLNSSLKSAKSGPQKRLRRFKSDDSSSDDDFDEDLLSEDIDSDDGLNHSDSETELKPKLLKSKQEAERRTSRRSKKPTVKSSEYDFDDDDDDDDESNHEGIRFNDEDDDDCQNEIELIQNIENRLLSAKANAEENTSSGGMKLPVSMTTPKNSLNKSTDDNQVSSEACAAANIAAAMKKRVVVVGAVKDEEEPVITALNQPEQEQASVTSKKTVNQAGKKAPTSGSPSGASLQQSNKKSSPVLNNSSRGPGRPKTAKTILNSSDIKKEPETKSKKNAAESPQQQSKLAKPQPQAQKPNQKAQQKSSIEENQPVQNDSRPTRTTRSTSNRSSINYKI